MILPNVLCFSLLFFSVDIITKNLEQSFGRLLISILSTLLIAPVIMYVFGLTRNEKNIVCNIVRTKILKK